MSMYLQEPEPKTEFFPEFFPEPRKIETVKKDRGRGHARLTR